MALRYPLPSDDLWRELGFGADDIVRINELLADFGGDVKAISQAFANDVETANGVFLALLTELHRTWSVLEEPMAALEDLVVDFHFVAAVRNDPHRILQQVAGVSEYEGEPPGERGFRRNRLRAVVADMLSNPAR